MEECCCCICCDTMLSSQIACPSCRDEICQSCVRRGLLREEAWMNCVLCRAILPMEWILESQSRKWLEDEFWPLWARWRVEQEMTLLPFDQSQAAIELLLRDYRQQIQRLPLLKTIARYPRRYPEGEADRVRLEKRRLTLQIRDLKAASTIPMRTTSTIRMRTTIMGFCPTEHCRGFLWRDGEDGMLRCGLCHAIACSSCGDWAEDSSSHVCNPDRVRTHQEIQRSTRPCPHCAIPIMHAGGCDQMWCTLCHVVFSWETGRILESTTMIHNPHYYDWIRDRDGTHEMVALDGRDIPVFHVYDAFLRHHPQLMIEYVLYARLHRFWMHLEHTLPPPQEDVDHKLSALRVQYLIGDLDKPRWGAILLFREKKIQKDRALRIMMQSIVVILRDIIRRSILQPYQPPTRDDIIQWVEECRDRVERLQLIHGGGLGRYQAGMSEFLRLID